MTEPTSSSELNIPYGKHYISSDDINAVEKVLRSSFLTQGPVVPSFEKAISHYVSANYSVAVNSATSALHLACRAINLGPGDYLWTSPITFVASANCGRYCGADVDFVDIDPKTGLMSVESLEQKLIVSERNGTLPKVVIPVHLCGTSCDMSKIDDLASRYGFSIIEDASHAIGGKYQDYYVGSCRHSSICVFSFHPVKIITTGEGGIATTNDGHFAEVMNDLRSHGITKDLDRFEYLPRGPWTYEQQNLGYNYRLTDLQAALGKSQLERLNNIIIERNRLLEIYQCLLAPLPVRLLDIPQSVVSSVHLAVIRLHNTSPQHHLSVFNGLRKAGIGVQLHYTPVHLQPYYRRLGFSEGDFPEAESYACNAITLPLYPGLNEKQQKRIVKVLQELVD